ncbi:hypothetical protein [Phyllobacterium leguminum]|uniref:Uncharacterized protein n=1 Tax=Phyllobacterium leguminum TaxID=314237 RepID=A0A318T4H1_9HYPH|nr:hypothetical protein [Phyllobacterium leguminum]PYE89692.1 hypothetical protein C7477_103201 [Phyllobacterium leguminum]
MNNDSTRTEVLSYIHQILGELQRMARSAELPMLAYFIGMACIVADDTLRSEEAASEQDRNSSA